VINEVEEETSSICQSDDEQQDSLDFKSSTNSDRLFRSLREENSSGSSQLYSEQEMRKNILSQEVNVPLTPTTTTPLLEHSALNATTDVKRIHSRLLNKEGEETVDPTYTVKQVLNPDSRKQKQISAKVKRKQAAQNSSRQRMGDNHGNSLLLDLPRDSKSSLDVLNCMISKVEHELKEYERFLILDALAVYTGKFLLYSASLLEGVSQLLPSAKLILQVPKNLGAIRKSEFSSLKQMEASSDGWEGAGRRRKAFQKFQDLYADNHSWSSKIHTVIFRWYLQINFIE
ncbi:PREDICTED: spindle and centriole-associated protein 1, partial [Tinamus guttatus]|uniref:spindle and centriole-associated protein 1 n=1 Tax=Tinamus guttatus TaxID=94827 RepID=UPI00052F1242